MSQATDWSVPLSGPVTPNEMADRMDKSFDALLSSHSGAARPAYAVAGTEWVSTATAGFLKYYVYDGASDRLIKTVDTATGAVTFADLGASVHAATSKTALADADELGLADSAASFGLKKVTLTNLISSIFKTTRKIANAYFLSSLRIWDATDNTKGLALDLSAITTATTRSLKMANADVDLARVNNMIGYDQTWQDMTGSRAASASYQNTTGRPIEVSMRAQVPASVSVQVSSNNSTWLTIGVFNGTDNETVSFIVPQGWYYRVAGAVTTISIWMELR